MDERSTSLPTAGHAAPATVTRYESEANGCAGCDRPLIRSLYKLLTPDGNRRPLCATCAFAAMRRHEHVLRRGRLISPRQPWGRPSRSQP